MPKDGSQILDLMRLSSPEAFDDVPPEAVEQARQLLGLTPSEMAGHLDWSARKYARVLEAARERGAVERDVALAVRGLLEALKDSDLVAPPRLEDDGSFLGGRSFTEIFENRRKEAGGWSADVAPHLLWLLAERATSGAGPISYGEAATMLEDRKLTHRVWPRTAYGSPLGLICWSLLDLGKATGERIPLLSVIVTRSGGDPSDGIDGLIELFLKQNTSKPERKEQLARLRKDRSALVQEMQAEVFRFPHWPGVVRALLGRDAV
ncbi:hypothetical protein [Jannaschia sp. W003]|uniref:hypothetical protein n=1 Tax=Jannaschia sp. W003 TaxID=2867012 RepID=UPI0021A6688C|nr:hypothetical protein [Jannaschia sp. W003]UWQ20114.1 hypothetical protein K3554_08840 [Jannaschia sp. W003]